MQKDICTNIRHIILIYICFFSLPSYYAIQDVLIKFSNLKKWIKCMKQDDTSSLLRSNLALVVAAESNTFEIIVCPYPYNDVEFIKIVIVKWIQTFYFIFANWYIWSNHPVEKNLVEASGKGLPLCQLPNLLTISIAVLIN